MPTTKVGLVTASVTPSARSAPRTHVVLPAPSSPDTSTTSPSRSSAATAAPTRSVSSADVVSVSMEAQPQHHAGDHEAHPGERDQQRLPPPGGAPGGLS